VQRATRRLAFASTARSFSTMASLAQLTIRPRASHAFSWWPFQLDFAHITGP